jgi:dihydroorotate dehydrogenase (NAD+) catalytic subunit
MLDLAPRHKHGLALNNPMLNSAGTLGFSLEYRGLVDLRGLGAFVTNPLTYRPRTPARPPNAALLPDGVLVHTGLPNPGVPAALRRWDREWRRLGVPVIVHLAATTPGETARSLELLERASGVAGIELGLRDDVSASEAGQLVREALGGQPLIVRLPLARAAEIAPAVAQAGADALTVGAPPRSEIPLPAPPAAPVGPAGPARTVTGRLYGPATFPAALAAVRAVAELGLGLPLIGAGGLYDLDAVREMLAAGAVAVQVDAAVWMQPRLLQEWAAVLGKG